MTVVMQCTASLQKKQLPIVSTICSHLVNVCSVCMWRPSLENTASKYGVVPVFIANTYACNLKVYTSKKLKTTRKNQCRTVVINLSKHSLDSGFEIQIQYWSVITETTLFQIEKASIVNRHYNDFVRKTGMDDKLDLGIAGHRKRVKSVSEDIPTTWNLRRRLGSALLARRF